jgi:hypothetical protein
MATVEASIDVAAPDAVVFDVAQDYALRLAWDPFLRELRPENGARAAAAGGRVWVRARNGLSMTVEYVTVDRPNRVAVKMVTRSPLFGRFGGSWSFEPRSGGGTRVVFRYGFETRWRALRPLFDRVVARRFARDLRERLRALKRGAEDARLVARLPSR